MRHCEPSPVDIHCLKSLFLWSVKVKGLIISDSIEVLGDLDVSYKHLITAAGITKYSKMESVFVQKKSKTGKKEKKNKKKQKKKKNSV